MQRLNKFLHDTSAEPLARWIIIVLFLFVIPLIFYSVSVSLAHGAGKTEMIALFGLSVGLGATILWIFTLWFQADLTNKFIADQNTARATAGLPPLTPNDPLVVTIGNNDLVGKVISSSYRAVLLASLAAAVSGIAVVMLGTLDPAVTQSRHERDMSEIHGKVAGAVQRLDGQTVAIEGFRGRVESLQTANDPARLRLEMLEATVRNLFGEVERLRAELAQANARVQTLDSRK